MIIDLNSGSPENTFSFGSALGSTLKGNELLFLTGELGSGKTMFTKGIGSALGIEGREIVSPSYTILNIYQGRSRLFHIDLYRIGNQIRNGIPEIEDNIDRGIIVVEWAEFVRQFYSGEKNLIDISIKPVKGSDTGRIISISSDILFPPGIFK
jgi:tRNA threonylcarbamoyladenosine biosynthesis protein TsaE